MLAFLADALGYFNTLLTHPLILVLAPVLLDWALRRWRP